MIVRIRQLAAVTLYTLADVLERVGDAALPDDDLDLSALHPAEQPNDALDAALNGNGSGHGEDSSSRRLFRRGR